MTYDRHQTFDMQTYQRELMPSRKRILMADLMNVFVAFLSFVLSYILVTTYVIDHDNWYLAVILTMIGLYIVLNHLLFMKHGFPSFGYFLFGVMYIHQSTGEKLSGWDFVELAFKRIGYIFVYHELYDTAYFLNSNYHQSIVMEKMNVLYAKSKPYYKQLRSQKN